MMKPALLRWGDTVFLLDSEPTTLLFLYLFLVNGIMLAAFRFPLFMLRSGRIREAAFLILAFGLLFLSSLVDMALSAGGLRWLHTAETGYQTSNVVNRAYSIASVHDMVYGSDNFASIELGAYLEALAHNVVLSLGAPGVVVEGLAPRGNTKVPVDIAVPPGIVVNEIIYNSVRSPIGAGWRGRDRVPRIGTDGASGPLRITPLWRGYRIQAVPRS